MINRVLLLAAIVGIIVFGVLPVGAEDEVKRAFTDHTEEFHKVWVHLLWDVGIIGGIFLILSIYFMFAYRRKRDDQIGNGPKFTTMGMILGWALIPSFIFMADDFYLSAQGWKLWIDQRTVPENAMEVEVTGQMWGWEFEYENGAISDNDEGLVVPEGRPVVLRMKSDDVVHSFFIPRYRIKEDLMPGRVTYLWFYPKDKGEHVFTCTEFCGTNHSEMWGKVKVVSQEEFDEWSEKNKG